MLDALQNSLSLWLSKHVVPTLQVVPDIDDLPKTSESHAKENDNKQDDCKARTTHPSAANMGGLLIGQFSVATNTRSRLNTNASTRATRESTSSSFFGSSIRTTQIGTLPVQRIDEDARPLTQQEMVELNNLLLGQRK